jgi:YbbR domain-containing protein
VSVRDAIVRHWPLKLAALALSIILWVVVASEETYTELVGVRLDVTVAPNLALAQPLPQITASVSGPGRELIKLYAAPLVVRAVLSEAAPGDRRRITLSPADVQLPREVKVAVQEIHPREIEILLDRRAEKTVAVRPVVAPEPGQALEGPVLVVPGSVRVSGARSLLSSIDSVATEPLELRGVSGAFERRVPLDTSGRTMLRMVPPTVTLSGRTRKT